MSLEITRFTGIDTKALLSRPRISYKVSEYVFAYLHQTLLEPNRLLQSPKYHYRIVLNFSYPITRPNKILYISPFATERTLFVPQKGFRTLDKTEKWAIISAISDDLNESIKPYAYARIVFYMLADFFTQNFKKVENIDFELLLNGMDRKLIESHPFPATFEEQRYSMDDSKYSHDWEAYQQYGENALKSIRDEYLKHYPF